MEILRKYTPVLSNLLILTAFLLLPVTALAAPDSPDGNQSIDNILHKLSSDDFSNENQENESTAKKGKKVKVHFTASEISPAVGEIYLSDDYYIIGQEGDWAQIEYGQDKKRGYIKIDPDTNLKKTVKQPQQRAGKVDTYATPKLDDTRIRRVIKGILDYVDGFFNIWVLLLAIILTVLALVAQNLRVALAIILVTVGGVSTRSLLLWFYGEDIIQIEQQQRQQAEEDARKKAEDEQKKEEEKRDEEERLKNFDTSDADEVSNEQEMAEAQESEEINRPKETKYIVAVSNLTGYSEPSRDSKKLNSYSQGRQLDVAKTLNGWYAVRIKIAKTGYMHLPNAEIIRSDAGIKYVVIQQQAKIREKANQEAPVALLALDGDKVEWIASRGDWHKVRVIVPGFSYVQSSDVTLVIE